MTDAIVNDQAISVLLLGDVILDVEGPAHWLSGIRPALEQGDVVIGHLEVPHTLRGKELEGDVPAPGADPTHLAAAADAGIDAFSLAGNHMSDCGPEGIADTIDELDRLGIAHSGAGPTLAAARAPAILTAPDGRRIALLSYNCVGPEMSWAGEDEAGSAYLPMLTEDGGKVAPPKTLTAMAPGATEILSADIAAARAQADLVIVALHKGMTHVPAHLAAYEVPVAHAAIDAGADIIASHHAHIVQGIELYRGKPIYHGLGNGCVVTRALSPGQDHPARAAWVERRKKMFGFEPDPAYTFAPFHPEAVNAMIGRVLWHADGRLETGLIPIHIEAPGRPVLADRTQGRAIGDYIEDITVRAGLAPIALVARDDMLVLQ